MVVAAIVEAATSVILSASSASSTRLVVALVEASTIRTLEDKRCKNSSRKNVLSVTPARSPSSCCMWHSNWDGLRSPSSLALMSCCSRHCSEAAVHLISCSLRTE